MNSTTHTSTNGQNMSNNPMLFNMNDQQEDQVIDFPFGLPGFEMLTKFLVVELPDYPPFHMLQSLEEPDVTMLILNLNLLKISSSVKIQSRELDKIGIKGKKESYLFVILKINSDSRQFTANIRAPLVINVDDRRGFQVILDDDKLSIEHPLENAFID